MLVLSRKTNEKIHIGNDVVITLVAIQGNKVRVGIEAPQHVNILRAELKDTRDRGQAKELSAIAS